MLKQKLIGLYAESKVKAVETPAPIAIWDKEIGKAKVALITTAGVHLWDQPIFQVEKWDSSYRIIPGDTQSSDLITSHTHFDRSDADQDINCVFPLQRLQELETEGKIGSVASKHYGLQGYIPTPTPLIDEVGPFIAAELVDDGVDIAILSPG